MVREKMREQTALAPWRQEVRCSDVATDVGRAGGAVTDLGRRQQRHVAQCLRCQADLAQQRKLTRALAGMKDHRLEPAPGFVAEVMSVMSEEPEPARPWLSARRIAYAGGFAAATAAGAVSAIVVTARSRRARLASG